MFDWIREYDSLLVWLGLGSIVVFAVGIMLAPVIAGWIPDDYFSRERSRVRSVHPVVGGVWLLLRSVVGLAVLLAGIAMLVLPGQGILTILLGLGLMSFPGKRALELRLVRLPRVLAALNWLRAKVRRAPLRITMNEDRGS